MAQKVFPLSGVGAYVNANFISVSLQMDRTTMDPEKTKAWYAIADTMAKAYEIRAYPTFLVFAPDGHVVHRMIGSIKNPEKFIARLGDALDTSRQYYTVIEKFPQHLGDSGFLRKALQLAVDLGDKKSEGKIADAYVLSLKIPLIRETLCFVRPAIQNLNGAAFHLFLDNPAGVDSVLHDQVAVPFLVSMIYRKEVDSLIRSGEVINFRTLYERLKSLYPIAAEQVIVTGKVAYYKDRKDEPRFNEAIIRYMDLFEAKASNYELNEAAWDVFQVSYNKTVLDRALEWSKRSVAAYPKVDWEYLDTYANLLYKTGRKDEAIAWEKKAIVLAKDSSQKKDFEESLSKMETGEKTWN
jgi:tetratricopeptide (TPR) repeat protein